MEELLQKIEENTHTKDSIQVILNDNTTDFITKFSPPIQFKKNKKYEVALLNLETYYSFPNINSTNNNFRYSPDSGTTWFNILIPEGSYEVGDIDLAIKQQMELNNHYDSVKDAHYISITPNMSTLKSILSITNNTYRVDFTPANSISSVLGFNHAIYTASYQESENVVNIMQVNSILVNVDIVTGSYVKGKTLPVIYSFFPNVSPGYKIIQEPINLKYLPITLDTIYSIQTTITDQDGNILNLRGELVTIRLDIREK